MFFRASGLWRKSSAKLQQNFELAKFSVIFFELSCGPWRYCLFGPLGEPPFPKASAKLDFFPESTKFFSNFFQGKIWKSVPGAASGGFAAAEGAGGLRVTAAGGGRGIFRRVLQGGKRAKARSQDKSITAGFTFSRFCICWFCIFPKADRLLLKYFQEFFIMKLLAPGELAQYVP